jgi:hypothetical protein
MAKPDLADADTRVGPDAGNRDEDLRAAMHELAALQKIMPKLTLGEIRKALHEGHKY